jgi:mersacidin/lichenicidin family type 2 lantibiotic
VSQKSIIRAWKDEEFRNRLSASEKSSLPANPAGITELSDLELTASGGTFLTFCKTEHTCQPSSCNTYCTIKFCQPTTV